MKRIRTCSCGARSDEDPCPCCGKDYPTASTKSKIAPTNMSQADKYLWHHLATTHDLHLTDTEINDIKDAMNAEHHRELTNLKNTILQYERDLDLYNYSVSQSNDLCAKYGWEGGDQITWLETRLQASAGSADKDDLINSIKRAIKLLDKSLPATQ